MTTATKKKMSAKSKAMWKRIKELQAEGYTLKEARAIYRGKPFPARLIDGQQRAIVAKINKNSSEQEFGIHNKLVEAGMQVLELVNFDRDKAFSVIEAAQALHQVMLSEDNPQNDE